MIVIVTLEIETGSNGTIAALFPNPEDQRRDLWRDVIVDVAVSVADREDQLSYSFHSISSRYRRAP